MKPNLKDTYFKRLKKTMTSGQKAMAEIDASNNPKKFMNEKSIYSLKGKKGIAG